jgi:hypothetical protein
MADSTSPFAPTDRFPERVTNVVEAKMAPNVTGQVGPDRFQEGIGTDTDVPNDFVEGLRDGYDTAGPNRNKNVFEKPAEQTMQERAHVGSAAWVEGPDQLGLSQAVLAMRLSASSLWSMLATPARSVVARLSLMTKRLDKLLSTTVCVDPYCKERGYHDHRR